MPLNIAVSLSTSYLLLLLVLGFCCQASAAPLTRDLPSYLHLTPGSHLIFGANASYFSVDNNMFGNDKAIKGEHSSSWYESVTTLGWAGAMDVDGATDKSAGKIFGSLTGMSINSGGYDAALSNVDDKTVNTETIQTAYMGWQSGDLDDFERITYRISAGRQNFHVGNGLALWGGGDNGGKRGDIWTAPRTAWQMTGVFDVNIKGSVFELFYISPDDEPDTDTEIAGINYDLYAQGPFWLGATAFTLFNTDTESREGLSVYNLRLGYNENDKLGFSVEAEYLWQDVDSGSNQYAWYAEFFWLSTSALDLKFSYRYATFNTDYDTLWYGGEWFQGAYTGNYLLVNENLQSHRVSVGLTPVEAVTLSAQAYFFATNRLNDGQFSTPQTTMSNKNLATELNVNVDWKINQRWNILFVGAWTTPHKGMEQWLGGDEDVTYFLVNTQFNL